MDTPQTFFDLRDELKDRELCPELIDQFNDMGLAAIPLMREVLVASSSQIAALNRAALAVSATS